MRSLMKGDREDTLAILLVLQSKGQFGKLRSAGCKALAEARGCCEPVDALLCVTPAISSASCWC